MQKATFLLLLLACAGGSTGLCSLLTESPQRYAMQSSCQSAHSCYIPAPSIQNLLP